MKTLLLVAVLLATFAHMPRANAAAISCVNSESALNATLQIAAQDGQDDDIRIVAGTYFLTSPLQYISEQSHSLTLSGRWDAACVTQNGENTVLNAGDQFRVLFIYSNVAADFIVTDLTIQNGNIASGTNPGAGLLVGTLGDVLIERDGFFFNQDNSTDGGLLAGADGSLTVRNNLFFGNSNLGAFGGGAGEVVCNGSEAFVTGNTVVGNSTSAPGAIAGLIVGGSAHFNLTNNILWANTGDDLYLGAPAGSTLIRNDVGTIAGMPPDGSSQGNLAVEPIFAGGLLNLRLASRSPLVNRGIDFPAGGAGATDLFGAQRRQGPHIDFGAFETDVLFFGGFEAVP